MLVRPLDQSRLATPSQAHPGSRSNRLPSNRQRLMSRPDKVRYPFHSGYTPTRLSTASDPQNLHTVTDPHTGFSHIMCRVDSAR